MHTTSNDRVIGRHEPARLQPGQVVTYRDVETSGRAVRPFKRAVIQPSLFPRGRSPDRQRSLQRRRRLAASGPMPPQLAAMFTTGQLSVLRIVSDEIRDRGRCTLYVDEIAARAGVCRRLAQGAIREAERLGLVRIEERRVSAFRNLTNIVSIVSGEWLAWLRISRKTGCNFSHSTAKVDRKEVFRKSKLQGPCHDNGSEECRKDIPET